jgi:hypothetical protein
MRLEQGEVKLDIIDKVLIGLVCILAVIGIGGTIYYAAWAYSITH